ncbi:MAG: hypothetical protein SNJ77_04260, partial [Cytophagales bacterium]
MRTYTFITFFLTVTGFSQTSYNFVDPIAITQPSCDVDVNSTNVPIFREILKRSVFKFIDSSANSSCSATLINNDASNGQPSNLFITAWHCFKENGQRCTGNDLDVNNTRYRLIFNYQAPTNLHHQVFFPNSKGEEISYLCNIKLIEKLSCAYGDFALCEILGPPLPPHFNVYYAGWNPGFITPIYGDYLNISHPAGSLKKAAKPMGVLQNPHGQYIQYGCHMVTKVIDLLIGWIWERRWSTEQVCKYLKLPFIDTRFMVKEYHWGVLESGSSGSGLFNSSSDFIGV